MFKRRFLIDGDPAKEVMDRWGKLGVIPVLNAMGNEIIVRNYTWPTPEEPTPEVPPEALDELGQYYDEILSHLRYWKETREIAERIWAATEAIAVPDAL